MDAPAKAGRGALAAVGGFVGAVAVAVVLYLLLRAIGVGRDAGMIAGGVVMVAAIGYLFLLGSRDKRTS